MALAGLPLCSSKLIESTNEVQDAPVNYYQEDYRKPLVIYVATTSVERA
jgi:hypothetical protein